MVGMFEIRKICKRSTCTYPASPWYSGYIKHALFIFGSSSLRFAIIDHMTLYRKNLITICLQWIVAVLIFIFWTTCLDLLLNSGPHSVDHHPGHVSSESFTPAKSLPLLFVSHL